MHDQERRKLAEQLRSQGYAYPYISHELGISKSTLSGWLCEIPYYPNNETIEVFGKARAAASMRKAHIRQESLEVIRSTAEVEIGSVSDRDLFMFGLGLYLGEGSKTHDIVRIVNADPRVIQVAIAWFRALGVTREQFSAKVYLYPDSDVEKSLQFWSETTSIPISQFHKTFIDSRTGKKAKKLGKLPHGTFHLGVRSVGNKEYGVLFFRKIQAWNEAVLKKFNTRD